MRNRILLQAEEIIFSLQDLRKRNNEEASFIRKISRLNLWTGEGVSLMISSSDEEVKAEEIIFSLQDLKKHSNEEASYTLKISRLNLWTGEVVQLIILISEEIQMGAIKRD